MRGQIEVTFQKARAHLGLETQRPWSDLAIARTTPALLGLFSLVALLATKLRHTDRLFVLRAAWYRKSEPTFADAIAAVRRHFWSGLTFSLSSGKIDVIKIPRPLVNRLSEALCYAA